MKRKLLSFALTIAMLLPAVPVTAAAADVPVNTTGMHTFSKGLAIQSDGTMVTWGGTDLFPQEEAYISIASSHVGNGKEKVIGLKDDGTLHAWNSIDGSYNTPMTAEALPLAEKVTFASMSGPSVVIRKRDGSYWQTMAAANNEFYPLCDRLSGVKEIAASPSYAFVLFEDGTLWGGNAGNASDRFGRLCGTAQLADNPSVEANTVRAAGSFPGETSMFYIYRLMDDVASIHHSGQNPYAIRNDGSLWTWGLTSGSGMGGQSDAVHPTTQQKIQQKPVKILDNVAMVDTSSQNSLAITNDGKLYVWGYNQQGQLGFQGSDAENLEQSVPVCVAEGVVDAIAEDFLTIMQKADGSLWVSGGLGSIESNDQNLSAIKTNGEFVKVLDDVLLMGQTPETASRPANQTASRTESTVQTSAQESESESVLQESESESAAQESESESAAQESESESAAQESGTQENQPAVPGTETFPDVPADEYYFDAVQWAVGKGITAGTSQANFAPDAPCTRGQIVTFLWRALGSPEPDTQTNPFPIDVKEDDYFYKPVLWASQNGITAGARPNSFGPEEPCTRAQAATFLWRAAGQPQGSATGSFPDVTDSDYFSDAVSWAVAQGITSGTGVAGFSPDMVCTRAQIVTFLYRSFAE